MLRSAGPYSILLDQCHAEECRSQSYTVGSVPCRGVQVPILYCWGQCHAEECRSLSYTVGASAMLRSAGPYPILLGPVPC